MLVLCKTFKNYNIYEVNEVRDIPDLVPTDHTANLECPGLRPLRVKTYKQDYITFPKKKNKVISLNQLGMIRYRNLAKFCFCNVNIFVQLYTNTTIGYAVKRLSNKVDIVTISFRFLTHIE